MATDNRTTLNDCSATTGWTGDDTVTVITDAGLYYQGGSSLSWQATNTLREMYTTSIGGTRDLSNAQVWMLIKDNLTQTLANDGVNLIIGDGTNRIGYRVGGYDSIGLPLPTQYNSYRLDVTNKPGFNVQAGVEANLNEAAITQVGYGTLHLSKANGAIDNLWMDRFSFIVNGNPALTINAGTVGTPETFADIVTDDITGGWGLISNLFGKQYGLFGATEWGDGGTGSSYFNDSNFQLFLIGTGVGAGNFNFRINGNGTGTNSLVWTAGTIIAIDNAANWDFSDTQFNVFHLDSCTFTDCGTFTFQAASAGNKDLTSCIFNNCGQIDFDTLEVFGATFNGTTDANGAIILDASGNSSNQQDLVFNSDGTGHAVYITAPGTYTFTNWTFNDYAGTNGSTGNEVVYNNSGGAVTINVVGGDSPTYRNGTGASTTVNNNINITVTGLRDNTEVRVYLTSTLDNTPPYGTPTEIAGIENATAGTTDARTFTFSVAGGTGITIRTFNQNWIADDISLTPSSTQDVQVAQRRDRVYSNPA